MLLLYPVELQAQAQAHCTTGSSAFRAGARAGLTPDLDPAASREHRRGLTLGLLAYGFWGVFPLYLKTLVHVPALEILCHRVLWGQVFLMALVWRARRFAEVRAACASPRTLGVLGLSTALIAINWLVYIWSVVTNRVLESSLGYFINPLVNVLLGVLVLKERLDPAARAAVALATLGVLWLTWHTGAPPWLSLVLALSFGLYGLLRKQVSVGALSGLAIETSLLLPAAVGFLAWSAAGAHGHFLRGDARLDVLLLLAGPFTAVPLLCFTGAARRLPLSTLGFLQYLSPSIQFALAVLVFGEPLSAARLVAFACIWAALLLFALTRR